MIYSLSFYFYKPLKYFRIILLPAIHFYIQAQGKDVHDGLLNKYDNAHSGKQTNKRK
jgi:hypothetical protein